MVLKKSNIARGGFVDHILLSWGEPLSSIMEWGRCDVMNSKTCSKKGRANKASSSYYY